MKFVLFVEGHTEKKALPDFLRRWLDSKLGGRVGIKVVRFDGWAQLVKDAPTKARMYLEREGTDVVAVIALLDLFGPKIYPKGRKTADARYSWAKEHLEQQVSCEKFRQFFGVHETEAWLLSDTSIFPPTVAGALRKAAATPEKVDFDLPPARLLDKLYKAKTGRGYKKVTNGKELFGKLDPQKAYAKCPRLREMLDDMLALAREAGVR
ncbi:MAG: DUF4276 family protein [Deltaproteobacteria bacterium]|nr:DUF4276 family protein [Deltaproteobacteria bacterium]